MDGELKLIPERVPESTSYSDAHVVQTNGVVTTIYFMQLPPTFSDRQRDERAAAHPGEVHAPTVASVTMPTELATKLAISIFKLVGKTPPEE
jgi:hypothetical protein